MYAERIVPVHSVGRRSWMRDAWARKPWRQVRLPGLLRLVLRHPRDAVGALVAIGALAAIIVNSLFMQPGPHPAPIFAIRPPPVMAREETGTVAQLPRPRPAVTQKGDAAAKIDPVPLPRPRVALTAVASHPDPIADLINPGRQLSAVQRVLNEFGYGPIKMTGTFDDQTRDGIERFERDHNLAVTGRNTARLRQALSLATGRPPLD
jgi:putative peptidoglycan binding protein